MQNVYYQQMWDVIFKHQFMSFILTLIFIARVSPFTSTKRELKHHGKEIEEYEEEK